jgi:hypothetical protein
MLLLVDFITGAKNVLVSLEIMNQSSEDNGSYYIASYDHIQIFNNNL